MLHSLRKLCWILILWLAFSVGCILAPLLAIFLPLFGTTIYLLRFIKAADRMTAALLGFSGRCTLSTELVHTTRLSWIRSALNEIEPEHCEQAAYAEGSYCRLSDHQLGDK